MDKKKLDKIDWKLEKRMQLHFFKVHVSIWLTQPLYDEIRKLSKKNKVRNSTIVETFLRKYLKKKIEIKS
jgi:hypothetical protein